MSEQKDKIYVGSGKSKFDGDQVAVSVCLSDLPKEFIFEYNDKKYVKLIVQKKREADQYGKTHYVAIDTFKPEQKAEAKDDDLF
jgi:CelD/BcsL family acetyltransferase involved in cellulose biosynthesis